MFRIRASTNSNFYQKQVEHKLYVGKHNTSITVPAKLTRGTRVSDSRDRRKIHLVLGYTFYHSSFSFVYIYLVILTEGDLVVVRWSRLVNLLVRDRDNTGGGGEHRFTRVSGSVWCISYCITNDIV